MFAPRKQKTTMAEGLKIVGSVTTDGIVEVHGQIEGELHCSSIIVSSTGQVAGTLVAENVVVDGKHEGPIQASEVTPKSKAHVLGDIRCQTIIIEKGAFMEGRLVRVRNANEIQPEAEESRKVAEISRANAAAQAAAEAATRKAELEAEAGHSSRKPNLPADEALVYLDKRDDTQAKATLNEQRETDKRTRSAKN